jgi:hypothetical protein
MRPVKTHFPAPRAVACRHSRRVSPQIAPYPPIVSEDARLSGQVRERLEEESLSKTRVLAGARVIAGAALAASLAMTLTLGAAGAATNRGGQPAPTTAATEIHGLPANNPAFGGSSANPKGGGVNGGNGIHDVNDGAPGHDGASAADAGEPPACTIHGGLADNDGDHDNRNCLNNQ